MNHYLLLLGVPSKRQRMLSPEWGTLDTKRDKIPWVYENRIFSSSQPHLMLVSLMDGSRLQSSSPDEGISRIMKQMVMTPDDISYFPWGVSQNSHWLINHIMYSEFCFIIHIDAPTPITKQCLSAKKLMTKIFTISISLNGHKSSLPALVCSQRHQWLASEHSLRK